MVTLPMRNSRSCNSLAFCTLDPNYLASGLDKVRGDHSLIIWDVSTAAPILSLSPGQSLSNDAGPHPIPPRRLYPHIPRADTGPRVDSRILQQHAQTETVTAVCFLPHSTQLLLAGISHRWLRLFDLRSATAPSITHAATKIQGIATDPFDPQRIASFGDGLISLWDSRKLSTALISFSEKEAAGDGAFLRAGAGYTNIEFSATRRGALAALERDSSYVRFWDLMSAQAHIIDDGLMDEHRHLGRPGRRSWANIPWPSGGHHYAQRSPREPDLQPSLVLSDTRRSEF
jgi:WD40 repeat protein